MSLGGHLAKMSSAEDRSFITSKMGGSSFWLGGRDVDTEGDWIWSDGSSMSWTDWGGTEPNGGTSEDCLAWWGEGRYWFDAKCEGQRYFVCSIKV